MEKQKGLKQEVITNTNKNCLDLQAKIFEYIPKEKHEEFMPLFLAYYHAVGTLNLKYANSMINGLTEEIKEMKKMQIETGTKEDLQK